VKEIIRSSASNFSSRRMLKEYVEKMYLPAASSTLISRDGQVEGKKYFQPESQFKPDEVSILSSISNR
jgi:hypothetical protein